MVCVWCVLMCFTIVGAHLHGSVVNNTDLTRFSSEVRSVSVSDYQQKIGAPNVDGAATRVATEWFSRVTNEQSLSS